MKPDGNFQEPGVRQHPLWSRKTAGICSAGRMWPLLWGIAIPAMRCVGTARSRGNATPYGRWTSTAFIYPRRRRLPPHRSQRLPSAERFERWVFDEVLPSIRRHGVYITPEKLWEAATTPEALMKLCSDLLAEREKNAILLEANAQLQGKAFYFDAFIKADRCTNLRITAKELEVPERRFVRFLLNKRFVYRSPSGCVLPTPSRRTRGCSA